MGEVLMDKFTVSTASCNGLGDIESDSIGCETGATVRSPPCIYLGSGVDTFERVANQSTSYLQRNSVPVDTRVVKTKQKFLW